MDKLNKVTKDLIGIPKFGNGIGLHRMRHLCKDILASDWAKSIDPINIVGSNGKGSTATIISCILSELKISYGKYTSPHLFHFTERILANDQEISLDDLEVLANRFFEKQKQYLAEYPDDQIGAFEAFTCIALSYFFKKNVDAVVLEAGIGGRYDSTRILTGQYSALVSIDLEHANIIGPTKELIAYDKIDIASEGATLIVGNIEADLFRRIEAYARYKKITLLPVAAHTAVQSVAFEHGTMQLDFIVEDYDFTQVISKLVGYHQVNNILVGVLLAKKWVAKNHPEIGREQFIRSVKNGLAKARWTGRLEKVREHPRTYIDVGHTPDAIKQIIRSFKEIKQQPCLLVLGVSYDKEVASIISELLEIADGVVCTRAYHKGAPVANIYKTVLEHLPRDMPVFQHEKIEAAIDFSMDYAAKHNMTVLVAGGLFLSTEAYHYMNGCSPETLIFF